MLSLLGLTSFGGYAQNVVANGDFSAGDVNFTCELPTNCTCIDNSHCVGTQMTSKCGGWSGANFNDHTTGTGKFLIIDGSSDFGPGNKPFVWREDAYVIPYTDYELSFWARSLYSSTTYPFTLDFFINTPTTSFSQPSSTILYGGWYKYTCIWNSGNYSGGINIGMRQTTPGAYRDFGMDDVYFGKYIVYHDNLAAASAGNTGYTVLGNRFNKCNITYYFSNGTTDMAGTTEQTAVINAFNAWAAVTDLKFSQAATGEDADIVISWGTHSTDAILDGPAGILSHPSTTPGQAYIHFDDDENWVDAITVGASGNKDLQTVAMHEIGHKLGLGHSGDVNSLMYHLYSGSRRTLTSDDINGIRSIYPYIIAGPNQLCFGAAGGYHYNYTNATNFTWTATGGVSIISGQGTYEVYAKENGTAYSGQLCVTTNNSCTHCMTITTGVPQKPELNYTTTSDPLTFFYFKPGAGATGFEFSTDNVHWGVGSVNSYCFSVKPPASYTGYLRSFNNCGYSGVLEYQIVSPPPAPIKVTPGSSSLNTKASLRVYPNPATQKLSIEINTAETGKASISLYDITGKLVNSNSATTTAGVNQSVLDVSTLENGVYFLKITSDWGTYNERVLIQH